MIFHKRMRSAILAVLLLCCLSVCAVVTEASEEQKEVTILFTHDIHSRMDEYKTETGTAGGFARLKTAIDQKKKENPATFVLDAGDFSMGTLFQTINETHAAELTMLGRIGVEATTFGNHEFDYRSEGVANMLGSAIDNAQKDKSLQLPQLVVSNIDWKLNHSKDNKKVQRALEAYGSTEYSILEHDGVRIGIYGLIGEDAEECAPESGIDFDDIVETSKRVVKQLQKEKVDMIVCLSHSGSDEDEKKSEDEQLAKAVPEIDLIISGHTHSTLEEPIVHGSTVIGSAGSYGCNLGEVVMEPDEDGRWKLIDYQLHAIDDTVKSDKKIAAYLDEYHEIIDKEYLSRFGYKMDQVLAENDIAFTKVEEIDLELHEDTLGSLISDSYIYAVKQAEGEAYEPIDLAVVPTGVIRDTFQKGEITVSDVFNVSALGIGVDRISGYPLVSVYLTGKELKTIAEIDVSVSPLMRSAQLFQSGMAWSYHPRRMILNRVTEVGMTKDLVGEEEPIDGQELEPIEDDKLYRVVAGLYSAQMLGAVEDTSKGILKVTPKNKKGEPIQNFEDYIICNQNGSEVKEWYALASYIDSFSENEEGISQIPTRYESTENRKVCEETWNPYVLLKNPNKIALTIYGIIILLVVLIVMLIRFITKKIRAKGKKQKKQEK